jgi:hypothetical protein
MFLIKIYINLGVFDTSIIMHKNNKIRLLIVVSALSTVIVPNGIQYQQEQYIAFGQAPSPETSVAENQTFSSALDTFVSSEPGGYGMYEDRKSNVFKPGETFLLYVEPVGYTYGTVTDSDGNRLYTMNFTLDFLISDRNGNVLGGQQDIPISNVVSHHQNKELILTITIDQSSPFPPGDYVITYRVTDNNSGKSFDITKDVTIQQE